MLKAPLTKSFGKKLREIRSPILGEFIILEVLTESENPILTESGNTILVE